MPRHPFTIAELTAYCDGQASPEMATKIEDHFWDEQCDAHGWPRNVEGKMIMDTTRWLGERVGEVLYQMEKGA